MKMTAAATAIARDDDYYESDMMTLYRYTLLAKQRSKTIQHLLNAAACMLLAMGDGRYATAPPPHRQSVP